MKTRTRFFRAVFTVIQSWISFVIAFVAIGLVWYGCYSMIQTYSPANLVYFKIGAWSAGILGLLMLILNEPIVVVSMKCQRIRERAHNPKLWDAVHAATPWYAFGVPRIYACRSRGMNAFAFGWGLPYMSAVAATDGAVDRLTDDELKAVMAHEMGHIVNKDMLVSMAMVISVMMMAFTGWLLLRFGRAGSGDSSSDKKGGAAIAVLVLLLVGFVLYVIGRAFGVILQYFVSRQREYAADAVAARIVGDPRPLMRALEKITANPHIGSTATGAAFGFLCTADPEPDDLMSTHPSTDNRLQALEALMK